MFKKIKESFSRRKLEGSVVKLLDIKDEQIGLLEKQVGAQEELIRFFYEKTLKDNNIPLPNESTPIPK